MPVFKYQVIDARGRSLAGTMPAPDEKTLEQNLRKAGLWLTEASVDRPASARAAPKASGHRVRLSGKRGRRELIDFCTLMTYQLRAGVPLVRALEVAGMDCKDKRFEQVVRGLGSHLESGPPISLASSKPASSAASSPKPSPISRATWNGWNS